MKLSEMKATAADMFAIRRPLFVWGPAGVGKSAGIYQFTQEAGIGFIDLRLSQMDPVDLRGFPYRDNNGPMRWAPSSSLPHVDLHGEKGVLCLDEFNAALPTVAAASYQLVLDRKLGEYELPPGWVIVAMGNREGDKGVTYRMPAPLANRFTHVEVLPDLDDFCKWAIGANIDPRIIAFLRFKPGQLHAFSPELFATGKRAFPTPRSWEYASDILAQNCSQELELMQGTVGDGAATEFIAFNRVWSKMPNPDAIVINPDSVDCPDDVATCYALAGALAVRATEHSIENIAKFAGKMRPEFQVVLMLDAITRDRKVANTKTFNAWVAKNSEVLI